MGIKWALLARDFREHADGLISLGRIFDSLTTDALPANLPGYLVFNVRIDHGDRPSYLRRISLIAPGGDAADFERVIQATGATPDEPLFSKQWVKLDQYIVYGEGVFTFRIEFPQAALLTEVAFRVGKAAATTE